MTSLFTTATMRSMTTGTRAGCASAGAASAAKMAASASAVAESVTRRCSRIFRTQAARVADIATNIARERVHRVGADPRYPVQLQLHEVRHRRFLRRRDEPVGDQPQHPAIAIVFRAGQAFERAVVEQGVIPAREPGPALSQRPLGGN